MQGQPSIKKERAVNVLFFKLQDAGNSFSAIDAENDTVSTKKANFLVHGTVV